MRRATLEYSFISLSLSSNQADLPHREFSDCEFLENGAGSGDNSAHGVGPVFVSLDAADRGIGKTVTKAVVEHAQSLNAPSIRLNTVHNCPDPAHLIRISTCIDSFPKKLGEHFSMSLLSYFQVIVSMLNDVVCIEPQEFLSLRKPGIHAR